MILTNKRGGQIRVEGKSLEALKRAGWTEVKSVQPSETKTELPKAVTEVVNTTEKPEKVTPAPKRTRRTKQSD